MVEGKYIFGKRVRGYVFFIYSFFIMSLYGLGEGLFRVFSL